MTKLEAIKTLAAAMATSDALSEAMRVAIMAVAEDMPSENKVVSEEPAPEPEPEKKPAKTKKPGTKGMKKIDDGKIRVLREGGWSITAIADEMKLSAPTIKAHLQKMGIK